MRYFFIGYVGKERDILSVNRVFGDALLSCDFMPTRGKIHKLLEGEGVFDVQLISFSEITQEHYNALKKEQTTNNHNTQK